MRGELPIVFKPHIKRGIEDRDHANFLIQVFYSSTIPGNRNLLKFKKSFIISDSILEGNPEVSAEVLGDSALNQAGKQ